MPLTLQIVEGHAAALSRTFQEGESVLVGRDPEARFRVSEDDPYFARKQFVLELSPGCYRLIDLKSKSGTYVNGIRVETAELKDGDLVKGGLKTKLLVRIEPFSAETLVPSDSRASLPETDSYREPIQSRTTALSYTPKLPEKEAFRIPGYHLLDELGRGGMGVVHRALRKSDGQPVAVKTIHPLIRPTTHAVSRFVREAEILRKLQHPGIVAGLDSGETGGTLWLAMEFVKGRDGSKILRSEGPLEIGRAVGWTTQLLEALAHAHDRDFIHRDVKPANMLISNDESGERVHLTDFGLARAYQVTMISAITSGITSGITSSGNALGTIKFMPQEQLLDARTVKPTADQYAAAATLYQLLTGKYLFEGVTTEVQWYMQILEGNPTPVRQHRPEIPESLASAIHRALARKPEERFPDVRAFSKAIAEAVG